MQAHAVRNIALNKHAMGLGGGEGGRVKCRIGVAALNVTVTPHVLDKFHITPTCIHKKSTVSYFGSTTTL